MAIFDCCLINGWHPILGFPMFIHVDLGKESKQMCENLDYFLKVGYKKINIEERIWELGLGRTFIHE